MGTSGKALHVCGQEGSTGVRGLRGTPSPLPAPATPNSSIFPSKGTAQPGVPRGTQLPQPHCAPPVQEWGEHPVLRAGSAPLWLFQKSRLIIVGGKCRGRRLLPAASPGEGTQPRSATATPGTARDPALTENQLAN